MEKINLIFFFCCFWKNVGENKFKFIFSAVLVKKNGGEKKFEFFFLLFTLAPSYKCNQVDEINFLIVCGDVNWFRMICRICKVCQHSVGGFSFTCRSRDWRD